VKIVAPLTLTLTLKIRMSISSNKATEQCIWDGSRVPFGRLCHPQLSDNEKELSGWLLKQLNMSHMMC